MAFEPQSGAHALIEAVFGFTLTRPLSPQEIQAAKEHHDVWREFLPRAQDIGVQEIKFGPAGIFPPRIIPVSGVIFDRSKPDGSIAWRLSLDQASILVNCLAYTTWEDVSSEVFRLMAQVSTCFNKDAPSIQAALFQTIDGFYWDSDKTAYRVSDLLNVGGDYVPASIGGKGHLWHLHQGWFEDGSNLGGVAGKTLNRVHFDAIENPQQGGRAEVRMDSTLQHIFSRPAPIADFLDASSEIRMVFDALHARNKETLRSYLSDGMSLRIGLTREA